MYLPGGQPFDEAAAFPWLADHECSKCLQIEGHAETCPNHPANYVIPDQEVHMDESCKIEGCAGEIVDARGPYAKLCAPHKEEKKVVVKQAQADAREARRLPVPAKPGLDADLLERAHQAAHGHPVSVDEIIEQAVVQSREAVEAAVVVAAQEIANVLRRRLADAIRGEK